MSRLTDKQFGFISSLIDEREVCSGVNFEHSGKSCEEWRRYLRDRAAKLEMGQASEWIERLLELPRVEGVRGNMNSNGWPDVPAGRYAVEHDGTLKFYRVNRPTEGKWAGYTFLDVQASDELHAIRSTATKREVLELIAADPKAAGIRYGRELRRCCNCNRTLTHRISRRLGIGPICGRRLGWIDAEVVAATREAIEAEGFDPDEEVAAEESEAANDMSDGDGLGGDPLAREFEREAAEVALMSRPAVGTCPVCDAGTVRRLDAEGNQKCDSPACGETFG